MTAIRHRAALACAGLFVLALATPSEAQQTAPQHQQAISANPFGLMLDFFNAEFERAVSDSATAGAGGSGFSRNGSDYVNADAFYRYYPSGKPLEGFAFGLKAGITRLQSGSVCTFGDNGSYECRDRGAKLFPGLGVDTNYSWLLGRNDNFYVGAGFGLKRLFGRPDGDLKIIPTIRLINVGIAF